ncbi:MAG TPA: protein kinase [Polyangia bacterium]|nr:protein kinase [Polyangia bacterium]
MLGGAYRITRMIGRGGMGAVYEATHVRLPKRFAVKFLQKDVRKDKAAFARFQREAEVASSIGNRHIAEVFDFNYLEDGSPYMVMEYLEGEDLAGRLRTRGRLTPREALDLCGQVSSALSAAHKRGIVHRDLKPENIFLIGTDEGDDFVKLLDFGISKIRNSEQTVTADMTMLGTPAYMSPEQARGDQKVIDARTDVYALGAVIYEALTGQPAFGGESVYAILMKIANEMPQPLQDLVPDLPLEADAVVRKALAKDPAQRYGTGSEFWKALRHAFDLSAVSSQPGVPIPIAPAHTPTPTPSAPRSARSAPAPAAPASMRTVAYRTPTPVAPRTTPAPPRVVDAREAPQTPAPAPAPTRTPASARARTPGSAPARTPATARTPAPEPPSDLERARLATAPTMARPSTASVKPSTLSGAAAESVRMPSLLEREPLSRRKARLIGAAAGVALVLGLWAVLHRAPRAPAPLAQPSPPENKPAAVAISPAPAAPPEAPLDPPRRVEPAPTPPAAAPAKPDHVRIRFAVTPRHATITLEGKPVSESTVTLPRSGKPQRLVISAEGYQQKQLDFAPTRDRTLRIELAPSGHERPHLGVARPPQKPAPNDKKKPSSLMSGSEL